MLSVSSTPNYRWQAMSMRMPVRFSASNGWNPNPGYYSNLLGQWENKIADTQTRLENITRGGSFYEKQVEQSKLIKKRDSQWFAMRTAAMHHQAQIIQAANLLNDAGINGLVSNFEQTYRKIMDSENPEEQQKLWNRMADTLLVIVKKGNL